jgi:beta-1,4-mannosyltransferase
MERERRTAESTPGSFTAEATRALRALEGSAGSPSPPLLLGYYPSYSTNPYQALLYGAARDHGIAPLAIKRESEIAELSALQERGLATVLHLHWLHPTFRDATSPEDARGLADAFLATLDEYLGHGGRLVWTVHNILSHEVRFDDEEARLSAEVVRRSQVIHVLSPGTADQVAPVYALPSDRILQVQHPSFAGVYPDHVSRADARHELGLMPDELVYLVLGALRPYKGLVELLDAWDALPQDRPRRLVIAGPATDKPGMAAILDRAVRHPTVLLDARQIPVPEMQLFLRAADVAVFTHRHALNSSVLMLALTFGLPSIVPAGSGLAEAVDDRSARAFEPDRLESLVEALIAAEDLANPAARAAAADVAARLDPRTLAGQFANGLRERLARTSSRAPTSGGAPSA